jgi:murein hydrolase activator
LTSPRIIPRLIRFLWLLCLLSIAITGFSQQDRTALERKRKQLLEDIQKADRLLKETTRTKEANLSRLMALQNQIKTREELVNTLHSELEFAESNISRTSKVVSALQTDLDNLEKEYGEIARQAYRQKKTGSKLLFVFSSEDFNQAFKRWQYLRQYEDFRQKQADLMLATQKTLALKIEQLQKQIASKEELVHTTEQQRNMLEKEKSAKDEMVSALQQDETKLRKQLAEKRSSHEEMNRAIEEVIQKEIVASRKTARTRETLDDGAANSSSSSDASSGGRVVQGGSNAPEVVGGNFRNNKGRLFWPVENGVITGRYGKQPHPTLKKIEITNNGVDIQTRAGEKVFAVFEGEVAGVQFIPGNHYMVIIKHGDYYTVYSNIETVEVSKGDRVSTRQPIGRLHVNENSNTSEVHFEVWQNRTRMNPASWIR